MTTDPRILRRQAAERQAKARRGLARRLDVIEARTEAIPEIQQ